MVPKLRIEVSMLKEIISPGESIPSWYGIAFIEEPWGNAICYPFGIHIAVRWARLLYESIQIPRRAWWEQRLQAANLVGYKEGLEVGKAMGANIDDRQVFSKSQLNRRIAVAVGRNNEVIREPIDEAWARGYRIGWEAALTKIEEIADMDADERRKLIADREAALAESVDPNEAQARRAESDKYSEVLQEDA